VKTRSTTHTGLENVRTSLWPVLPRSNRQYPQKPAARAARALPRTKWLLTVTPFLPFSRGPRCELRALARRPRAITQVDTFHRLAPNAILAHEHERARNPTSAMARVRRPTRARGQTAGKPDDYGTPSDPQELGPAPSPLPAVALDSSRLRSGSGDQGVEPQADPNSTVDVKQCRVI